MLASADDREFQRVLGLAFIASLVVCFSPLKTLAYATPAVVVGSLLVVHADRDARNRAAAVALAVCGGAAAFSVLSPEFLLGNYVLALVTYSAFLPLVIFDSRRLASTALLERVVAACLVMIAIQGTIGVIQAVNGALVSGSFGGSNGDRVEGTIHLPLPSEMSFANPMFTTNMVMMLLVSFAVPAAVTRRRLTILVGLVAIVLASVMHILVFLVASLVVGTLIMRVRTKFSSRRPRAMLVVIALVCGLTYAAMPAEVGNITVYAERAVDLEAVDIPRAVLVHRVLNELPDQAPLQPYVGLGPGQFSSRASLIASGLYLGGPDAPKAVPLFDVQATQLAVDYCFSLYVAFIDAETQMGSTQQPFFSWLSLYTEFGLVGVIAVLAVVFRLLRRVRRRAHEVPAVAWQARLFASGVVFLMLLGIQENYWEVPQAIFVGVLLLKILYGVVMHGEPAADAAASGPPTGAS